MLRTRLAWIVVAWALEAALHTACDGEQEGAQLALPPAASVAHPAELLVRVYLKAQCAPDCRASKPIDLKASVSGLAPGVEYELAFYVQARHSAVR